MNSRKIIYTLLISLLLVGFISPLGTAQANTLPTMKVLDAPQSKIDSALQGRVNALQTGESMTVIVTLRQQAVLSQVAANTRAARQQGVIRALQAVSDASQTRLKNLLDARQSQGDVSSYTSFWIFNGFSVTANSAVINELAQHPDVSGFSMVSRSQPIARLLMNWHNTPMCSRSLQVICPLCQRMLRLRPISPMSMRPPCGTLD